MRGKLIPVLLVIGLGAVVLYKAWVSDDSYITFRTIENVVQGRGLVWNPGERVQAYTHPLWMFWMWGVRVVSGDFMHGAIASGIGFTAAAGLMLAFGVAGTPLTACAGLALLTASRAFTDFSTSGLENPLLHVLLAGLIVLDAPRPSRGRAAFVAMLVGGCLLTRLDAIALVLPAWAAFVWRTGVRRALVPTLAGLAPLVAWEAFSLVYYGSLLPNSAVAKLTSAIPSAELARQGLYYLRNSLVNDPITLSVVALAAAFAWVDWRNPEHDGGHAPLWPWCCGTLLSLAYVVSVGGDFMSGRFLTAPFFVSVAVLVARPRFWIVSTSILGLAVALLSWPWTSPFVDRAYGERWDAAIDDRGVADERSFYARSGSLRGEAGHSHWPGPREFELAHEMLNTWPDDPFLSDSVVPLLVGPEEQWPPSSPVDDLGRPYRKVYLRGAVGFLGFHLGAGGYLIDYHALGDPFLSRLPMTRPDPLLALVVPRLAHLGWRVGHYFRRPPAGYVQTIATGRSQIHNPQLAEYYEVIKTLTRDPLWDRRRLATIVRFQLGYYDGLLRAAR